MVRYKDWTENEWKRSQYPKEALKDLEKAWRIIAQEHLEKYYKSFWLELKYKETRGGPKPLHSIVNN